MSTPNKQNLFSIVMPAWNAAKTIEDSIASITAQTYPGWELLVVDDASSDATVETVKQLIKGDNRIRLIRNSKNSGVAESRNRAIEDAKGTFICFLDSDDLWMPDSLALRTQILSQGENVVFGSYLRLHANGKTWPVTAQPRINSDSFLWGNPIGNLTGAYNCANLGKVYQKSIRHEDCVMWHRIVQKNGSAIGIKNILGSYRVSVNSLSGNKFAAAQWQWNLLRNELGLSTARSIQGFAQYAAKNVTNRLSEKLFLKSKELFNS